jgi:Ca2+-dependent lipid-binding protein
MGKSNTDIKVRVIKCTHLVGSSMLPGWSSDPYVIVKLCDHDEVLHKKQTKTVNNDTNPEFDEKFKFKEVEKPADKKLKFEIWDSDVGRDDKLGKGHFSLGELVQSEEYQQFEVVVDGGWFTDAKIHFEVCTDGTWGNPANGHKGDLKVVIHKCEGLDDADYAGTTDPYAYITIDGCDPQQTSKKSGTLNPKWEESFDFRVKTPLDKKIHIKVYDDDGFSRDDCIGSIDFELNKLKFGQGVKELEKTIDMNWMGMVKGATLYFSLEAKDWGNLP